MLLCGGLCLFKILSKKDTTYAVHRSIPFHVKARDSRFFSCSDTKMLEDQNLVMKVVPSVPFGRLGNVMLALAFAALHALEMGCHLE